MADVITIPLTTIPVGDTITPSISVADTDTMITVEIDRTVVGGFNALTPATILWMTPYQSNDGGATWQVRSSGGMTGGVYTNRSTGTTETFSGVETGLLPGTGRRVRAVLTVTGSSVAVQGTVTAS